MKRYDLVVIGAGSGNTVVDDRFADRSVAIIERGPFGGTCLNRGCIPSKMLVATADRAHDAATSAPFGVSTSYDGADWPAIRDRVFSRLDGIASDGHDYRVGLDHVTVLDGTARFTGPRRLEVTTDAGTEELEAGQVVLAVGSRPVVPDVPGLDEVEVHTSDTVMRLDALPGRIGIIGGGYIGCELAHIFDGLGSEVLQVESGEQLLGNQDEEVSEVFTAEVSQRWDVRLETELSSVRPVDGGRIELGLSQGGPEVVDVLLLAVGRVPNTDGIGLDLAGVETDERGRVVVDAHQRTTAEGVWALGDASSPEPLKHVANQDARVVQHNLLHPDRLVESDHRFVPNAVFTHPQVASVGLTEAQARDRGLDLAVGRNEIGDTAHGWALLEDRTDHRVKLLADRATGRLVGAHLIGPQASALVQPLIQAMSFDQPARGLARGQYWIHPALTETVENALLALEDDLDA
ncbi:mycothione reductase [Nocardioides litoris]|uniref:mycothione reductase n=1 Tax=Nocardioides litoris TaxID=1926648 RepID=UPI001122D373|nr:mycothione reductase [Nocardioides litoris]